MNPRGSAVLGLLKLGALGVAALLAVPVMHYAFQQAAESGQTVLWLALAVIVPMILVFIGWMIRDSGNLRDLGGRFQGTKETVEKIDEAQERIFRELGALNELRSSTKNEIDRLGQSLGLQDSYRHSLRNEINSKILDGQETLMSQVEKLEERVRVLEIRAGTVE